MNINLRKVTLPIVVVDSTGRVSVVVSTLIGLMVIRVSSDEDAMTKFM